MATLTCSCGAVFTDIRDLAVHQGHASQRVAPPAPTAKTDDPVPMLLWCPSCFGRHIDRGEYATKLHHTHACQYCGVVWRPAVVATVGVEFLPGFRDE